MSFVNPFAPKPRGVEAEVARVKALVRRALRLADDAGVTVSELVCRDPACPGLETVILVLPPGRPTRLLRIAGPMAGVTEESLAAAAAAGVAGADGPRPAPGPDPLGPGRPGA